MSCPYRTLVTNVRGHPSGNQRKPTHGGSGSFHCGGGVRPRPVALHVPPRWPFFWCALIPWSIPGHHFSTSVTRTPEEVLCHTFTSSPPTPPLRCGG
ncbi:Folate Receptor Beta [Manis pentadactyla]|nr:Folate Receptor Beta [Manis pentadactyla]